jgi:ATP-dependent Clp endopeptidase proteolytic subunit ClpP
MMPNKWYEMKALANGATEIFVFDEIGYWGVTAKDFARDLKEVNPNDSIELHVNSPGGSVTDGIAIYNLLKNHKSVVNVHIDGLAASMASVIAMAGDTITMPENALMMIHNPWGGAMGDAEELRKTADVLDKMKTALISAYANKTGKEHEEISALMDSETWMTGAEAVEMGFANQVTDEIQLAASFDTSKLNNFSNDKTSLFTPLAAVAGDKLEGGTMPLENTPAPTADQKGAADSAATASKVNVEAVAAKAVSDFQAKETARKQGIRTAFGSFASDHGDLLATCIEDMDCSVDKARESLLAKIGEGSTPQAGGFTSAFAHAGNGAIVKESMVAAVKSRAGIKLEDGELTQDNPFKGMTMGEMARASLEHKGVGVAGFGTRMALVGAAFTHGSSDFGSVLADVANKSMLKGYEEAQETFQLWTQTGTLSDFKTVSRVGLNDFNSLREVQEGAEYKYVTVGDRGETVALGTYGELFSITRQAIINDDLSAFTRIPQMMGVAAIRTIGDLVYAVMTDNPKMSDGKALFHNDHNNLFGAGSALSVSSLDAARTAMRKQKLDKGKALNIRPEYLLVPAALETTATKLMRDTVLPGASNGESNPVSGMAQVISEARLDDSSATAWYLAAGSMYDTIEVSYLDGNSTPFIDQMDGWGVDGTSFKVRIDAGVSPLDYRTVSKSTGAA